jgi:ectoine hydroxylase
VTLLVDNYPTRADTPRPMIDRIDPVVWGREAGPLDADALSAYRRDGFHCTNPVIDHAQIDTVIDEVETLHQTTTGDDPRIITEHHSRRIRTVFAVHQLLDSVRAIAYDPAITAVARQILGSDVYIHQSRINFKPGFGAGPFYWHSDFETWHAEDGMPTPRAVSLSIALTPNYVHNGSLMIMPGTHTTFVPAIGATPAHHHQQSLQVDIPPAGTPSEAALTALADRHGIRVLTGAAGSGIFFDSNCIHGSNGNITPYPRSNLFLVYNSVENTLQQPFAAGNARPEYLAHRTTARINP